MRGPVRLLLGLVLVAALCSASTASAGEFIETPIGGSGAQVPWHLAPGADGSVFFVQQWVGSGSGNPGDRLRIGRVDASGSLVGTVEHDGNALFSSVAPAPGGRMWLAASGVHELVLVGADLTVTPVTLPQGVRVDQDLALGRDGRLWFASCGEHCQLVAVSVLGDVARYDAPGLDLAPGTGGWSWSEISPTDGGVWFGRTSYPPSGAPVSHVVFSTYGGAVSTVALPEDSTVVAPADGNDAWFAQQGPYQVGKVGPDGSTHDVRPYPMASQTQDTHPTFGAGAGRSGDLLVAQDTTDPSLDGRLGLFGGVGEGVFDVPMGTASIPTDEPHTFSGACTFGGQLFEAADGALWSVGAAHPDRITRRSPTGAFSTFVVPSALHDPELRLRDRVESGSALWFAVETSGGARLARVDPLDPPPGLPTFADAIAKSRVPVTRVPTATRPTRKTTRRALLSGLAGARLALIRLRAGRPARLGPFREPLAGVIAVRVTTIRRGRVILLAAGRGQAGPTPVRLRSTAVGRRVLRQKRALRVTITAQPAGGSVASAHRRLTLPASGATR